MVAKGNVRQSGETTAGAVTKEISESDEALTETPTDEAKKWRTPGFHRMRLDWSGDDREILNRAKAAVEGRLQKEFTDAYQLIYQIYDAVRTPQTDGHGTIVVDQWGRPLWAKNEVGAFIEDYSLLTTRQKEDFMFALTTRLFVWKQRAADAWGEAMLAKAQWEERFSIGFDAPISGTVDDRTAAGRLDSKEERYFAIFLSLYSRKCEALISSMEMLGQRLKDLLTA